jgi:hypothetical protein
LTPVDAGFLPMARITISKRIEAPLARVFAAFTDLNRAAERITGITRIEVLTPGPFGAGTRWRESRTMFGKEATEEMEVTALTPGESYTVRAVSCGAEYLSEFHFQPEGLATLVEVEVHCRPVKWWCYLLWPFCWLMQGTLKKCMDKDLEDMKQAIEAEA